MILDARAKGGHCIRPRKTSMKLAQVLEGLPCTALGCYAVAGAISASI